MGDLNVIDGLKVVARWKDNPQRHWGGDLVRLEGDLWDWDVCGSFFNRTRTPTASITANMLDAYKGVYGPPDWTSTTDSNVAYSSKVAAANNDGRDTCYSCGASTKTVMGFTNPYQVCTKCGK
jgi:hypothetical protein